MRLTRGEQSRGGVFCGVVVYVVLVKRQEKKMFVPGV